MHVWVPGTDIHSTHIEFYRPHLATGIFIDMHAAKELRIHDSTPPVQQYKVKLSGGRLNKKDGLTRYGDSHVKDKTS